MWGARSHPLGDCRSLQRPELVCKPKLHRAVFPIFEATLFLIQRNIVIKTEDQAVNWMKVF